ncbi:hypothetical protein QIO66_gp3 [ssRNA phage Gephyllon.2_9]|jgi:hypothetical protein|uniref:Uncharacterized protein n=1 Tax=ssRNA phage Gephyllon.2_9 TaxID=2786148 RepID=A0A8S5KZH0_9VIRU|nr:hypothetical protein QIO66_gp3 [ssRNA phage Gephyllon.2_9]DAD50477.1 TPA_asm: hypothetical protein [ssRNA phage Gephyllon.2_9]
MSFVCSVTSCSSVHLVDRRPAGVNSIRVGVTFDGSRYRDLNIIQVTIHVGANHRESEHVAFQRFLQALYDLREATVPLRDHHRI